MFASVVDAVVTRLRESQTMQTAVALGAAAAEAALDLPPAATCGTTLATVAACAALADAVYR